MRRVFMDRLHPTLSFSYLLMAMVMGVVIQHPVYLCASILSATLLNTSLYGREIFKKLFLYLPVALVVAFINPVFNTLGDTVIFRYFGRPYTVEALLYGAAVGGMILGMLLWFSAYNRVMTDDKFSYLFGTLSPSLSLLLTTVLRMIPNLQRKLVGILDARKCIGMSAGKQASLRRKLSVGTTAISVLTSQALEGGVVTADSMNSRGYGTGKRSSYQMYHFSRSDLLVAIVLLGSLCAALIWIFNGGADTEFIPKLQVAPLNIWGFCAYLIFLLTPTVLNWKEEVVWYVLRSGI